MLNPHSIAITPCTIVPDVVYRVSGIVFWASRLADIAYPMRRGCRLRRGMSEGLAFVPQSPHQTRAFRTNAKPLLTPLHFFDRHFVFFLITVWECGTSGDRFAVSLHALRS
jgi:hypothetical protein